MDKEYYYAVGRRKTATATVRLYEGKGESKFNGKPFSSVYKDLYHKKLISEPFEVCGLDIDDFHFTIVSKGGGVMAQLEAARLGISRALILMNPELKKMLKQKKLTTRDPRMVESKKTGMRKARKSQQYSKR
ncbi:30S ribosomal protein S9 [Candidatus Dojkabacteria bacterium]|uniref:30S ribosomal protein S9 n=1 Tax=Candidatus Dojkabacteria bacterium TaxID=2099670 RepID=A0A3M0YZM0_9BACT|nr:MAG: 30S ribosomal protein S9 [Candidatus Dojkabacteria bacterium]